MCIVKIKSHYVYMSASNTPQNDKKKIKKGGKNPLVATLKKKLVKCCMYRHFCAFLYFLFHKMFMYTHVVYMLCIMTGKGQGCKQQYVCTLLLR